MATSTRKNSVRLKLKQYEDQLNALFEEQENMKAKKAKKKTVKSSNEIPEMPWGGIAGLLTNFANQANPYANTPFGTARKSSREYDGLSAYGIPSVTKQGESSNGFGIFDNLYNNTWGTNGYDKTLGYGVLSNQSNVNTTPSVTSGNTQTTTKGKTTPFSRGLSIPNQIQSRGLQKSSTFGLKGDLSKRPGGTVPSGAGQKGWLGNNWQGLVGLGSSLLAPAFNIGKGLQKPVEHVASDYYNPYGQQAISDMSDRKFNIDPILEGNLRSQKTYNRNISQGGATSSGQLFSNYGAGLAGRMRADTDAYTKKSNIENQYLAELAQTKLGVGEQMAGVNWQTDMANLQNQAARDAMVGTGLGQIGQAGQMWSLMQGQKERDRGLASILPEGLSSLKFAPEFLKMITNYTGR